MTPNTDSVAVLREMLRDKKLLAEADLDLAPHLAPEIAALDAAIAALSAQGDAVAWASERGIELLRQGEDSRVWGVRDEDFDITVPLYLHPAPPGSDAVTEEMAADVLVRYNATAPSGDHWPPERLRELRVKAMQQAITNAALAARTGKGEANV